VGRLVVIAPGVAGGPYPDETPAASRALGDAIEAAEQAGDLDEVNRLEAHLWLDGPAAEEGRVDGAPRELFLDMNGRALAAADAGEKHDHADAWDRAGTITAPTLVLIGDLDLEEDQSVVEGLAGRIPGAQFERLAGTAHLPQLEAHARFLDAVLAFV
jgi:pimeloyl-ACP methyl ester carboxylesterase